MKFMNKYGVWIVIIGLVIYLFYRTEQAKPDIEAGEMAPEFSFVALDGNTYTNSSFKGQFVLIDFWGSWCRPCKVANAKLKHLYQEVLETEKYRENFSLVSIAYEKDSSEWLNAIENQKLTWPIQAMEKQNGNSPMVRDFKIQAFPTNFLINPDGRIVAVNVSQTTVIKRLKEQ